MTKDCYSYSFNPKKIQPKVWNLKKRNQRNKEIFLRIFSNELAQIVYEFKPFLFSTAHF